MCTNFQNDKNVEKIFKYNIILTVIITVDLTAKYRLALNTWPCETVLAFRTKAM